MGRQIREEDPQKTLPVMDLKRLLEPEVVNRVPDWPTNQRPELRQNLTTRADQVGLKMELTASGVTRFMTQTPNRLLNFVAVFLIQPKVSFQSSVMIWYRFCLSLLPYR